MLRFIFISGPPGSGKSTQAKLIGKELGFENFDSGEMIRKHLKSGDIGGGGAMGKGLLMPIKNTLALAKKELSKIIDSGAKGIVIGGIPRSLSQAFGIEGEKGIVDWFSSRYKKDEILFINLEIPEEETVRRNLKRNEGRVDDKPDVLKTRLKVFREKTLPVFSELKKRGYNVVDIDGTPSKEEVFESIKKHLRRN